MLHLLCLSFAIRTAVSGDGNSERASERTRERERVGERGTAKGVRLAAEKKLYNNAPAVSYIC